MKHKTSAEVALAQLPAAWEEDDVKEFIKSLECSKPLCSLITPDKVTQIRSYFKLPPDMKYTQHIANPYSDNSGVDIFMFACLSIATCFGTNRDTFIYIGAAWILAIVYINMPRTWTTVILPTDAIRQDRLITKKEHK